MLPPGVRMSALLLEARNLTKVFRLRSGLFAKPSGHVAVNSIDLELMQRERIGVVGESGSGKSTLGRLLLGLTSPTLGEVRFEGVAHTDRRSRDWSKFRMQTSLVQQNPLSALNPQMTIGQQVAEAVWVHRVADRAGALDRTAAMLERVGLSSAMMNRFPHQMSGGQRQRVVIARALILEPKLVVFDEAVSALDVSVQAQVVSILRSLWQELDLAYVFITHDLRIVRHLVDRIAVMYLGRAVETGDIKTVYEWPRHPYTRACWRLCPRWTRGSETWRRPSRVNSTSARSRRDAPSGRAARLPSTGAHPNCRSFVKLNASMWLVIAPRNSRDRSWPGWRSRSDCLYPRTRRSSPGGALSHRDICLHRSSAEW